MTPQQAQARLYDRTLLIGRLRRRAAIDTLVGLPDTTGVGLLAAALANGHPDPEHLRAALSRLRKPGDADKVVELWRRWLASPSPALAGLLADLGWPAGRSATAQTALAVVQAAGQGNAEAARAAGAFWQRGDAIELRGDADSVRALARQLDGAAPQALRNPIASVLARLSPERDAELIRQIWQDWSQRPTPTVAGLLLARLGWPGPATTDTAFAQAVLALANPKAPAEVLRAVTAFARTLPQGDATLDDAIFAAWLRSGSTELEKLIGEQARRTGDPALQALHALVSGRLDGFDTLGGAGSPLVAAACALATEPLRPRLDPAIAALARRASEARARTLVLPEAVSTHYSQHPCAVLGLHPSLTTTRVLVRRRDDLLALAAAGLAPEEHITGFVSVGAAVRRHEADIVAAVARLQNEPERCRESLLWFRLADEPEGVRAALATGSDDEAEALWRERAHAADSRANALHNLAVLAHRQVIARESASAPPHGQGAPGPWCDAFARWQQALAAPGYWDELSRWQAQAGDPRLDAAWFEHLRAELPLAVLAINARIAQAAADAGFAQYAACHVGIVRDSGFAPAAVAQTLDGLFTPLRDAVRKLLAPLLVPSARLTESIDFAALRSEYLRLRERCARFGSPAVLAPLATEAAAAGRKRLLEETNAEYAACTQADTSLWRLLQACIEEWNQRMDLHNRGLWQAAALRGVHQVLTDDAQPALRKLSSQVDRFAGVMRREQAGFELLLCLEADAEPGDPARVRALMKNEDEALARVRSEFERTRSLFQRTLDNVARNCRTL
jgi:hypothetical protein